MSKLKSNYFSKIQKVLIQNISLIFRFTLIEIYEFQDLIFQRIIPDIFINILIFVD